MAAFRGSLGVAGISVILGASPVAPPTAMNSAAAARESAHASDCDSLYEAGRYEEAEALARSELEELDGRGASATAEGARVLRCLLRSLISRGAGSGPELVALGERLLELTTALHGPHHADVAVSEALLGRIHERRGDYATARELYERALATRAAAEAPADESLATNLISLANLRARLGDYDGVDVLYERAIAIYSEALGPDSAPLANALGNYAIYKKLTGDHAGARELYERALALQIARHGREHTEVARLQYNLGNLLVVTGDFAAAREAYGEALAIRERVHGPDSPQVARTLEALALLEEKTADLLQARRHAERALAIHRRTYPEGHPRLAHTISVLASILAELGDVERARELLEQVLAIYERRYGPDHPHVAEIITELGFLEKFGGERSAALARFRRARSIEEQVGGDDDRVASLLNSEARVLLELGRPEEARSLARRSVEIRERIFADDHPYLGWSLMTWGRSLWQGGDQDRAVSLMRRARGILEDALGESNPLCLEADYWYARALHSAGDVEAALELALRVERSRREFVRLVIGGLPERLALLHSRQWPGGLDLALSLACSKEGDPTQVARVWEELIRSRALVLDEMALRHRVASNAAAAPADSLMDELMVATRKMAELLVQQWEGREAPDFQRRFATLRTRREAIERKLGEQGHSVDGVGWRRSCRLDELAAALAPGRPLIAYTRYQRTPRPANGDSLPPLGGGDRAHYAAFVLVPGRGDPLLRDLGPAAEIDLLVRAWRDEAGYGRTVGGRSGGEAEAACRRAGAELRARIWDPIAAELEGAEQVYVVPDGPLHLVNFAALPADGMDYLLDRWPPLVCLGAERDLLALPRTRQVSGELLALGAPDFTADCRDLSLSGSADPDAILAVPASGLPAGTEACGRDGLYFAPLPASADEVATILALWHEVGDDRLAGDAGGAGRDAGGGAAVAAATDTPRTLALVGSAASEAAFKRYAPGYRALHIATHGFFLGREITSRVDGNRGVGGLIPAGDETAARSGVVDPMLLAGLALAGANTYRTAGPGDEDGILVAAEIAALDLAGVEWVVLSACESGVGLTQAGEGVLGLRRAFTVAGARTLVISLWPLSDADIRDWMLRLYDAHLAAGLDLTHATWAASRAVLADRRAAGLDTHPHTWAGFIACGD
jgi:tetratricopeptide (TPR) repeat protein/CHAT domain-containing protein